MMKDIPRRVARKILYTLYDKPLAPPSPREKEALDEFKRTMTALGDAASRDETNDYWRDHVASLARYVSQDDVRSFIRWEPVRGSMFVDNSPYVRVELRHLRRSPLWASRWSQAIVEDRAGRPYPYPFRPRSSGNRIHHAYHLAIFEERTGQPVDRLDTILEFGGGYGSVCRLCHKLGFRGRYTIFDLPPFSALQRYYLTTLGIDVLRDLSAASQVRPASGPSGVACVSDVAGLASVLPREGADGVANGLFIATWSFSESPLEVREKILPFLGGFGHFLIAYQSSFEGVDNVRYFAEFAAGIGGVEWQTWEIEHIPKSYYLIGRRR